jgi:hypothetical protein
MARIRSRSPPPATVASNAVSEARLRIQLRRAGRRAGLVSDVRAGSRLEMGGLGEVGSRLEVGAGVGGGTGSTVAAGTGSAAGVATGSAGWVGTGLASVPGGSHRAAVPFFGSEPGVGSGPVAESGGDGSHLSACLAATADPAVSSAAGFALSPGGSQASECVAARAGPAVSWPRRTLYSDPLVGPAANRRRRVPGRARTVAAPMASRQMIRIASRSELEP